MKEFNIDDYKDLNAQFISGTKKVNVTSTTLLIKVFTKLLINIKECLNNIIKAKKVSTSFLQRFVV